MRRKLLFGISLCLLLITGTAVAQDTQNAPREAPSKPRLTPLKVQLVLSRYSGEKKITSLPYVLLVTANDREPTHLRMGVDVTVSTSAAAHQYRSVGTSIDCRASSTDGGFMLFLTIEDSSIHFDSKAGDQTGLRVAGVPSFRNFTSKVHILLRDGQTAQFTSATDPVSGDVTKVDVTLNVIK